jgi:T4-like virus tail tube protein gp19
MADLLNSNEIFFTSFEPKVKNRFLLYMDGIPSFLINKVKRPTIKSEKKTLDHINIQRYYKGKSTWDNITMELYDAIVPSGAQAVMEWVRLSHESVTGRDGYTDFYKKDLVVNVLGPVGDKVEEWKLVGAFITSADFGELDWKDTGDPLGITLELSVDYCVLQF